MKNQSTFSDIEYQNRKHTTPKEEFLDAMNEIVPWDRWIKLIEPYYPKGKRGRPTRGIYEFMIGINGFTNSRLDDCIKFFMGGIPRRIELEDEEQYDIFNSLDAQCREHLGQGCEDLLKEAESEMT